MSTDVCIHSEFDLLSMSASVEFDDVGAGDGFAEAWARAWLSPPMLPYLMWMRPHQSIMPDDFGRASSFRALSIYQQCLHPLGIHHGILAPLARERERVLVIGCGRISRSFSDQERISLNMLAARLTDIRRAAQLMTVARLAEPRVGEDLSVTHVEFVVVNRFARPISMSDRAPTLIQAHVGPFSHVATRLPERFEHEVNRLVSGHAWLSARLGALELVSVPALPYTTIYLVHREHLSSKELAKALDTTEARAEVARRICRGHSRQEIASTKGISVRTVDAHLRDLRADLRVADRSHVVPEARRRVTDYLRERRLDPRPLSTPSRRTRRRA
jgi:DNA-binding CsgD family transcriptional regulator